jgi:uncharacterized protein (TIGR04141 family)
MGSINLYKIDKIKEADFVQEITRKLNFVSAQKITKKSGKRNVKFELGLYISASLYKKPVNWNWLSHAFNNGDVHTTPNPKAVLTINYNNFIYAVTFGYAHFVIDKFCDRDFGFTFARKISFKEVKTTTLTNPNTRRNKTVNTYINYNELEFDSGESYAKLKVTSDIPDNFTLFKPSLEIGSSIKFSIENDSLDSVLEIILFVEETIIKKPDIYKIPVFSKVTNETLLSQLDNQLTNEIHNNPTQINISELDIIGATEVFNRNDGEFIVKYENYEKQLSSLDYNEIESFCFDNKLNISDILLNISVISVKDGEPIRTDKVKNLIDYTNDIEKCILSKGIWYKYNDDYLQYLRDSLQEINVIYNPDYDFTKNQYNDFIGQKYDEEKNMPEYRTKDEKAIKNLLRQKYYAERSFNIIRSLNDGFQNYDRIAKRVGTSTIEITDLYKDKTMYAVKIGGTSAKLCYAIDQSLTSLKMYKHGELKNISEIDTVVIWLVLERQKHLGMLPNGKINIDELSMLMLKNRIDQWKKEVRLAGFSPFIYVNYKTF